MTTELSTPKTQHATDSNTQETKRTCKVCGKSYTAHTPEQMAQERPRLLKSACSEHCGFILGMRIFGKEQSA